jgi:hypothetical protein
MNKHLILGIYNKIRSIQHYDKVLHFLNFDEEGSTDAHVI